MNRSSFVISLVAVAFSACAHKPATKEAKTEPAPAKVADKTVGPRLCSGDLDCGDKQLCSGGRCVDITADLAECSSLRVHFPFNSDQIDGEGRSLLERNARCLKGDRGMKVVIEGNADERGTEEYNLALGDRRAVSVSKYLQALGASEQQLQTVSFGKEDPICQEHSEDCWSTNRRAAVKPTELKKK